MRCELALHQVAVEVEERQRLELRRRRRPRTARAATPCDRSPAEPGDHGVRPRAGCPRAPCARSAETIPPMPTASAFSSDDHALARRPSASRTSSSGNGRKDCDAERADPHALVAQLVDGVLDRAEHRAERDDDRLGVLGAVAAHAARRSRGRRRARSRAAISGIRSSACICLACARYLTSVNASGPTIAPIVIGSSGSSSCRGSNARQERVDLLLGRAARRARRRG